MPATLADAPLQPGDPIPGPYARRLGWILGSGIEVGSSGDTDGDGLSDAQETGGWLIVVDEAGFGTNAPAGILVTRTVFSDPSLADTDGDGLSDWQEFLIRSDPSRPDTDGDALLDREEWFQWLTSPNSVDTDGDCRGPNHDLPPSATLFDGIELRVVGTSPVLDDTDGDGRTDFEELDEPTFHPLIANLPRAAIELVGEVDVRLNVEYAESVGQSSEYGQSFTESQSSSQSESNGGSTSTSFASHQEFTREKATTIAGALTVPPSFGVDVTQTVSSTEGTSQEIGNEVSWTASTETAAGAEQSYSSYVSDSLEQTEVFAAGTISTGVRLRNTSSTSFTLTNLGITVLEWEPSADVVDFLGGTFKTMGTLTPALESVTLAPGEATPILEVSANDIDPDATKQFLSHPSSLVFQPASFDLLDADGIDFDFLTETTFTRTARVEIDRGGGDVQVYRVATNVAREADGSHAGVTMREVMQDILEIPYTLEERMTLDIGSPGGGTPQPTGILALASVDGLYYDPGPGLGAQPAAFWTVLSTDPATADLQSFESIRLYAGDYVRLVYTRDQDADGLFEVEEDFYGTSDLARDSDGDLLFDDTEVKIGWVAGIDPGDSTTLTLFGYPRRVYSDPRVSDTDGDGRSDGAERAAGTDPTHVDTDRDGLSDSADPFPLVPAQRLHVKADHSSPGDGTSWAAAFTDLQDALAAADLRNGNADPTDDVAEIWVARGSYAPAASDRGAAFVLRQGVSVYGGFLGVELVRGQRDSTPLTNQTVLSGELGSAATPTDNSYRVVEAPPGVDGSTRLDGFTIQGGYADEAGDEFGAGICARGAPHLVNLLVYANTAGAGAGLWADGDGLLVEDCSFVLNEASLFDGFSGGGAVITLGADTVLRRCSLDLNTSYGAAGAYYGTARLERCTLSNNTALDGEGGGAYFEDRGGVFDCDIVSNTCQAGVTGSGRGGGVHFVGGDDDPPFLVVNSRLWNNTAAVGGGIDLSSYVFQLAHARIINTVVAKNHASSTLAGGINATDGGVLTIQNAILWDNTSSTGSGEYAQVHWESGLLSSSFSTIQGLSTIAGPALSGQNPQFVSLPAGNLRLTPGSPCVDTGFPLVDLDPELPGFQPLGPLDLDGNPRIADGDGFDGPEVDRGPYELQ